MFVPRNKSEAEWMESRKLYWDSLTVRDRLGTEVYDNGGETIDRYTVSMGNELYTMSDSPLSPLGVNQYYGGWTLGEDMAKYGQLVEIDSLPVDVQRAIESKELGFWEQS